MRLGNWTRITKADFPDMPEWAERMADSINRQMEALEALVANKITFSDNVEAEVRTLPMPDDTTVPIQLQRLKTTPLGVLVLWTSFYEYPRLKAQMNQTKAYTVDVSVKWDNAPSTDPTVILLFLGG